MIFMLYKPYKIIQNSKLKIQKLIVISCKVVFLLYGYEVQIWSHHRKREGISKEMQGLNFSFFRCLILLNIIKKWNQLKVFMAYVY